MARENALDVETLLAHEAFVRSLARRLVGASDEADDVAQETFVRAIERPPAPRQGIAGWLTTVARNVVRQRRRGDRRRARRETAAARPDVAPTTERLLEREVARRTVVEAVLELGEPYRTVVVLRWLEGLRPSEVAARLGVPVETVRTRVRRGIEQLRERLDRRHEGRRAAWLAALLPLAEAPPAASAVRPRAVPPAAALLSAAGAATLAYLLAVERPRPEAPDPPATFARIEAEEEARATAAAPDAAAVRSSSLDPAPTAGTGVVRGFVLDPGRRPAEGARVLARCAGPTTAGAAARETATDAQGRFEIPGVSPGPWIVEAVSREGGRGASLVRAARDPPWASLWLRPATPRVVAVWARVLDAAGRPVSDASVEVLPPRDERPTAARTGLDGYARVDVRPGDAPEFVVLEAAASGALVRRRLVLPTPRADEIDVVALDLVLSAPGRLEGRVEAGPDASLEGARLVVWPASLDVDAPTTRSRLREAALRSDGRFDVDRLPPDVYALALRAPGGPSILAPDGAGAAPGTGSAPSGPGVASPRVEVASGTTASVVLRATAGGAARGVVTRADGGAPLEGAQVEWTAGPPPPADAGAAARLDASAPPPRDAGLRTDRRVAVTDAEGRYEVRGLAEGRAWRVRVEPAEEDAAVEVVEGVAVLPGEVREMTHRVRAAGSVLAVLDPDTAFGLGPSGASGLVRGVAPRGADGSGETRVTGLAPGEWDLLAFPTAPRAPFRVARFEVAAGVTTRVEEAAAAAVVVRGRVTRAGQPVEGAWVSALGLGTRPTGPDGRFEFEGPMGVRMMADLAVCAPGPDAVEVRLPVGCMSLDTGVIEPDLALPTGTVEAHVLGPTGRALAGARATLRPRGGEAGAAGCLLSRVERTTDAAGGARWSGLPRSGYEVEVEDGATGTRFSASAQFAEGAERAVLGLREPRTGRVRVRVLDEAGRPAPGARARVLDPPDGLAPREGSTSADGSTTLRGLPTGRVRLVAVRVDAGDPAASTRASPPVEVEVRADEERAVTLRLAAPPPPSGEGDGSR